MCSSLFNIYVVNCVSDGLSGLSDKSHGMVKWEIGGSYLPSGSLNLSAAAVAQLVLVESWHGKQEVGGSNHSWGCTFSAQDCYI